MIEEARLAVPYTPEQLADRLGKQKSLVYRLENEEQVPDFEYINKLASLLPLSVDGLARAAGLHLNSPRAADLPNQLVDRLLAMTPAQWQALLTFLGPPLATESHE